MGRQGSKSERNAKSFNQIHILIPPTFHLPFRAIMWPHRMKNNFTPIPWKRWIYRIFNWLFFMQKHILKFKIFNRVILDFTASSRLNQFYLSNPCHLFPNNACVRTIAPLRARGASSLLLSPPAAVDISALQAF